MHCIQLNDALASCLLESLPAVCAELQEGAHNPWVLCAGAVFDNKLEHLGHLRVQQETKFASS